MIDPLWIVRTVAEAVLLPYALGLLVVLLAFIIGWVRWQKSPTKSEQRGCG